MRVTEFIITPEVTVSYRIVSTPKESPVGILENATLEIIVDGRVFHRMDSLHDGSCLAIDVETGDIVRLINEGMLA